MLSYVYGLISMQTTGQVFILSLSLEGGPLSFSGGPILFQMVGLYVLCYYGQLRHVAEPTTVLVYCSTVCLGVTTVTLMYEFAQRNDSEVMAVALLSTSGCGMPHLT